MLNPSPAIPRHCGDNPKVIALHLNPAIPIGGGWGWIQKTGALNEMCEWIPIIYDYLLLCLMLRDILFISIKKFQKITDQEK